MRWKYLKWQLPFQPVMKISPISLVYTSVTNCRRQSPTVLSLEQATMCVIASRRSNALELSESKNSRPTEWQNDPSTELKFKCEYKCEFKFLYWHREITLYVLLEWPHTLSVWYRVGLYAWVESIVGIGWPVLTISFNLFAVAFPWILLLSGALAIRATVACTNF